ncbi:hypothetical protein Tco_0808899 [Tanacetum coccineum]
MEPASAIGVNRKNTILGELLCKSEAWLLSFLDSGLFLVSLKLLYIHMMYSGTAERADAGVEMVAAYDDKLDFIRELDVMSGVDAAVKTTEFLNETLLRLAREINGLCAGLTAVIEEREQFSDELDILVDRFIPRKMVEFMRETQSKDTEKLMKMQILGREFELRAWEKNLFIKKLKGNMDY